MCNSALRFAWWVTSNTQGGSPSARLSEHPAGAASKQMARAPSNVGDAEEERSECNVPLFCRGTVFTQPNRLYFYFVHSVLTAVVMSRETQRW